LNLSIISILIKKIYLGEQAHTDANTVKDDPLWFGGSPSGGSVRHVKEVVDHVLHLFNVFLLRRLDSNVADVLSGTRIDTGNEGRNGWIAGILSIRPRMSHASYHQLLLQQHTRTVKAIV